MATAANFLTTIGADEWDSRVYAALSSVSKLAATARNRANVFRIAYLLRRLDGMLANMFTNMYETLEGKRPAEPPTEEITPQRLHEVAENLDRLARTLAYMHEQMRRTGLTNNSLTASPLHTMLKRVEEIDDIADWFETAAQSVEVSGIFTRGQGEKDSGDVFHLSQVD